MLESIILGAVQGIAEWLPISSEAMVVLVKHNIFPDGLDFSGMIALALFLHIGTLLSVLVYFRKRIRTLLCDLFFWKHSSLEKRKELSFLGIATVVSGILGYFFLKLVERHETWFLHEGRINMIVACFLLVTALLLYLSEQKKDEEKRMLSCRQGLITGFFQSFAALPGISRSGSTIAAMGLVGIEKKQALELSFLLSIPLVLGANIVLNFDMFSHISLDSVLGLISAFIFGIFTIQVLMKLVERIRFSGFVAVFGLIVMAFTLFL